MQSKKRSKKVEVKRALELFTIVIRLKTVDLLEK